MSKIFNKSIDINFSTVQHQATIQAAVNSSNENPSTVAPNDANTPTAVSDVTNAMSDVAQNVAITSTAVAPNDANASTNVAPNDANSPTAVASDDAEIDDIEVTINLDSSLDSDDSTSGIQPSTNR